MFLKKLTENKVVTIDYYKNGSLQTYTGHICYLNLTEQILSLKDEKQNIVSIRLSGIKEIH